MEEKIEQLNTLFSSIFKRKSFHMFRDAQKLSPDDLDFIKKTIENVIPLDSSLKYEIILLNKSIRGSEYSIYFYAEKNGLSQQNIGYMGEQIDLALVSHNIGTLWYGIGREKGISPKGYPFVIMMGISKMKEGSFRKDMFSSNRNEIEEFWSGDMMSLTNIVRFAPSACNSQPWEVECEGESLLINRVWPKSRGIMPKQMVAFFNRIDMGIFLLFLEVCLTHDRFRFERELFEDTENYILRVPCAKYKLSS